MLDLIIEGAERRERQRAQLAPGRAYVLGRDKGADISIAWDPYISRRHVELTVKGHRLRVSLSPAYWPMMWPSPEPVTLTVYARKSSLHVPVRGSMPGERVARLSEVDAAECPYFAIVLVHGQGRWPEFCE